MAKANAEREKLQTQLQQLSQVIELLEAKRESYQNYAGQHDVLTSVVDGLYTEVEKLTKKAPAEQITELALEQINDVIKDTKELIEEDAYVQKLKVFVPAGDMPQLRDALLVLSQIKQGLLRYKGKWSTTSVIGKLSEAEMIKSAIEMKLNGENAISIWKDIKRDSAIWSFQFPEKWKIDMDTGGYGRDSGFDFERLETVDLFTYFGVK